MGVVIIKGEEAIIKNLAEQYSDHKKKIHDYKVGEVADWGAEICEIIEVDGDDIFAKLGPNKGWYTAEEIHNLGLDWRKVEDGDLVGRGVVAQGADIIYPNRDEYIESRWKHNYKIKILNKTFIVNADHDQEAIDYVIDYCSENLPGLVSDEEEYTQNEDYISGGNEGKSIATLYVDIGEAEDATSNFDVIRYDLPAYWASYLVNGDASGLEDDEIKEIDTFMAKKSLPAPSEVSDEPWFASRSDANSLGGDVLTYTFLIPKEKEGGDPLPDDDAGLSDRFGQKGEGRPPLQDGGVSKCVCDKCGKSFDHERGTPCVESKCPECGEVMVGRTAQSSKPQMFGTDNDTEKWALMLDSAFELFDTKEEAYALYDKAMDGEDSIEDTPFGSIVILPPNLVQKYVESYVPDEPNSKLSEFEAVDMNDYIEKEKRELQERVDEESEGEMEDIDGDMWGLLAQDVKRTSALTDGDIAHAATSLEDVELDLTEWMSTVDRKYKTTGENGMPENIASKGENAKKLLSEMGSTL